jgi:predicted nucleotidyltransferase/HEPN domain-containing protein
MKNSINHLPEIKQDELQKIVETIQKSCKDVEKIILFGSYARGSYKEAKDIKPNSKSGHISDYDILVVTKEKETALNSLLWSRISVKLQVLALSAHPKIITHDIAELNNKLSQGQYFFSDIKKEGILLFDSKNFELVGVGKLNDKEKQKIAKEHFDYWFKRAENFFKKFDFMFSQNQFTDAAFDLHQVAESCYKAILLVFSNYTPREHFLAILGKEAGKHYPELKTIFHKTNKEDEDRFKLLEYAYIGGRYDPKYHISKEDLEVLAKDVKKLLKLTEEICEEKI